ncbi:MAG: bifunctional transcriptional activator/DNA repair enzyme AdaA [Tepidisphaeraceae bacterium]
MMDPDRMWQAFVRKDPAAEGLFVIAVKTTGIFCRPTCRVKPPLQKNVEFFATPADAQAAGYRPCLRCRPESVPTEAPVLRTLRTLVDSSDERWTEKDLERLDLDASTVRRNFRKATGLTFAQWQRERRALQGMVLHRAGLETPIGRLTLIAAEHALLACEFPGDARAALLEAKLLARFNQRHAPARIAEGTNPILDRAMQQLREYFAGERRTFAVPLDPPDQAFARAAWEALAAIPYGQTRSYAQQALAIGRPTAVRAVAQANGSNLISIILPCHRVIGADGTLTGYGGGLERKRWLLAHEQAVLRQAGA